MGYKRKEKRRTDSMLDQACNDLQATIAAAANGGKARHIRYLPKKGAPKPKLIYRVILTARPSLLVVLKGMF
jgi:hypothetical protein